MRWGAALVGAVGAFVLAMMVITGFEWASGETLGGNGSGTTIGRVAKAGPGPDKPAAPVDPQSTQPSAPASEPGTSSESNAPESSSSSDSGGQGLVPDQPSQTVDPQQQQRQQQPQPTNQQPPKNDPGLPLPGLGG